MTKTAQAILNVLRDIGETPDGSIVMYEIGIPLVVEQKYDQQEVADALFELQREGMIELSGNNTLRLIKPLPDGE